MVGILWASFLLSAGSYLASCALFVAQARRRPAISVGPGWAPRLLEIGAGLQLAYLILFSVMDRRCPVYALHSALNLLSLVGAVTFAVVRRGRRLEALGGFVAALAAIFLVAAHAIAAHPATPNDRWLLAIHITANFLGGGIILIAGCASLCSSGASTDRVAGAPSAPVPSCHPSSPSTPSCTACSGSAYPCSPSASAPAGWSSSMRTP